MNYLFSERITISRVYIVPQELGCAEIPSVGNGAEGSGRGKMGIMGWI